VTDDDCPLDCTDDATWPASWKAFESEVLTRTNQRRAAGAVCGGVAYPAVPSLSMDPLLRQAARCHSLDMTLNHFLGHVGSNGESLEDRVEDAGYEGFGFGENIAEGHTTPNQVMGDWMASAGHCENIMWSTFTEIGIGLVLLDNPAFKAHWTQDFATGQ
jgi:uncharacterized protein YkwD